MVVNAQEELTTGTVDAVAARLYVGIESRSRHNCATRLLQLYNDHVEYFVAELPESFDTSS